MKIGTPISAKGKNEAQTHRISPLKFKSVIGIEEMGDKTLVDLSMEDINIDDQGFVVESPKMSQRRNTRYFKELKL